MTPITDADAERIASKLQRHDSGERPAADVTEKSRFGWPVVLAAISAVAFAVTGVLTARAAQDDAGTALSENKTQGAEIKALQIQDAKNSADHEYLKKSVDEVKAGQAQTNAKLDAVLDELRRKK